MTVKLIKTTGGSYGTPPKCCTCGLGSFIAVGVGWHCAKCLTYVPRKLVSHSNLKTGLAELTKLHKELKTAIKELETLVKE